MRLLRVLLLVLAWLCLGAPALAQRGRATPPPPPEQAPPPQDGPRLPGGEPPPASDPNFVFPYVVAFLLVGGVLLVVCMPSRKST